MQKTTIYGLDNEITYCEAKGLSKVFDTYAKYSDREYISEIGFNCNSGAVYISLDNGVEIVSFLGRDVVFLVTDFENGEEAFFDTYEEATQRVEEE